MPFQDVIQSHFSGTDITDVSTLIGELEALIQPNLRNLTEDENNKLGIISEKNKLFVNKVNDYRNAQPALSSPDVDWGEFQKDYSDRLFLETTALRLQALAKAMLETKRLHDHDNFENASIDYKYSQYKNETQPGLGYDTKVAELAQFFEKNGGGNDDNESPTPPGPNE